MDSSIVVLVLLGLCNKKEGLNLNDDSALIEAMESARNQSDEGIDIEALEKSIGICHWIISTPSVWGDVVVFFGKWVCVVVRIRAG